tara:strand:- start:3711 stop:4580 length:870 start_codon:yes stop_codon:yes gene_type:complete
MKYKVITTFKPGDWERYAHRMVMSVLDNWPDVEMTIYHEGTRPKYDHDAVSWIDIDKANNELKNFRTRHKGDPVANGKLNGIVGGVRRSKRLETEGGLDAKKESYLWNAVKFSFKVSCITHAVKTYTDYDYVIWLDDDTYTFRPIPKSFIKDLCPTDTLVTYLGRENDRGSNKYPECGLVGYNIKHDLIQNFIQEWQNLYASDKIFDLLEWHDSYVFWHMTKEYRHKLGAKVHDIGYVKGVKGHHVFVNSILGNYIDHFKGDRKIYKKSRADDIRKTPEIKDLDYWRNK